ncbi:MAG: hypothetical protein IKV45_03075 [Firmicutes bacterium]|nr:hypothetical protein [Bacillota bacterium]
MIVIGSDGFGSSNSNIGNSIADFCRNSIPNNPKMAKRKMGTSRSTSFLYGSYFILCRLASIGADIF